MYTIYIRPSENTKDRCRAYLVSANNPLEFFYNSEGVNIRTTISIGRRSHVKPTTGSNTLR